ncbi:MULTISPECIES: hypothetical protein [Bacillus]|uniref:Uncharacterized protein n=1 Tax=Bacillus thuringiensis T01-328 TaxID=1324966 RepID=A0AAN4HKJ7_BACTU|nr:MULTISPECIES: hypothetical protein [Bacillus]MEC0045362.1 hypothetical protein [Bacillus cereus]AFV21394.1 hypothetical protein BTB_502p00580 [Bacillus thuringiensis Bt407]EEM25568.1 hypothetical protein bthur0002_62110 [Bacillus thuringiensis Bt407]ERI01430.1 hypothetical protein BTCBT_003018 [Bacillus thuringiensis T01-328]MEC2681890.1 hypothetical protein [Bacillus thuringiensis]
MSKKREIFRLLEEDCVNPTSEEIIKKYINNLIRENEELKKKKRKVVS